MYIWAVLSGFNLAARVVCYERDGHDNDFYMCAYMGVYIGDGRWWSGATGRRRVFGTIGHA